jgi:hypothetical protein
MERMAKIQQMKMSSNKQARTTAFGSPIRGSPDRISPFI